MCLSEFVKVSLMFALIKSMRGVSNLRNSQRLFLLSVKLHALFTHVQCEDTKYFGIQALV